MTNLEEQFQSEAVVADRQVHNSAENEGELLLAKNSILGLPIHPGLLLRSPSHY